MAALCQVVSSISIHALLAESDHRTVNIQRPTAKFLSTLSLRRATSPKWNPSKCRDISIHALLAESDANGGGPLNCFGISIHALLAESDRR